MQKTYRQKYSTKENSTIPCALYSEAIKKKLIVHIGTGFKLVCERSDLCAGYPSFDFILTCSHVMIKACENITDEMEGQDTEKEEFDENWYKAIFAAFKVQDNINLVVSFSFNFKSHSRIVLMNKSLFLKVLWEKTYGH